MDEYYYTGNAVPGEAVKKGYAIMGVPDRHLSARDAESTSCWVENSPGKRRLPILQSYPSKTIEQGIKPSLLPQQGGMCFIQGPARGKLGSAIKMAPFPATALPTQHNDPDTLILQQPAVATKKSARKKQLSFAIRLVLTLLLFFILFKSMSWSALLGAFTRMSWGLVFVALVVGAAGVVVSAYQWRSLLLGENIYVDLAGLVNLYMVGIGFSHFLPTGMGGDAVKALFVGRESSNSAGSISAVVLCRVTGFIGMLLIAFVALILWRGYFASTIITSFLLLSLLVGSMLGGAVISVGLLPRLLKGKWKNARIFSSVLQVGGALYAAAKRPRSLLVAILYGIGFQAVAILNCYAYANALGIQASLRFFCVAVPLIALVAFLPISINGYGLRESTYVYIFSTLHIHAAAALLLALMQDAQTLVFGIIGGCIYLKLSGQTKAKEVKQHNE